jgi:hypothetical protein
MKHMLILLLTIGILLTPYWWIPGAIGPGDATERRDPVDQPPCHSPTTVDRANATVTATVERLPNRAAFRATYNVTGVPPRDFDLSFDSANHNITVEETSGFTNRYARTYTATADDTASVVYAFRNEAKSSSFTTINDIGAGDRWAYGPLPATFGATVKYEVNPDGVVYYGDERDLGGQRRAYVGSLNRTTIHNGCQTVTLAISEAALVERPDALAEDIGDAIHRYPSGKRFEEVTLILAPWHMEHQAGFAQGRIGIVSSTNLRSEGYRTALIHEYLHTRQVNNYGPGTQWLLEAVPTYYSYRLQYDAGVLSSTDYARDLSRLGDRATWNGSFDAARSQAHYTRGAVTLAALDERIRETTDGNQTLVDVIQHLEDQNRRHVRGDLRDAVANTTGTSMDSWFQRHVYEGDPLSPPMPGGKSHSTGTWQLLDEYDELVSQPTGLGLIGLNIYLVLLFSLNKLSNLVP